MFGADSFMIFQIICCILCVFLIAAFESLRQRIVKSGNESPKAEALEATGSLPILYNPTSPEFNKL